MSWRKNLAAQNHRHRHQGTQGLQSHSAKHTLAPTEVYVGISFRLLGKDEPFPVAADEYVHRDLKEDTASEDIDLETDQRVLLWGVVISDGVGIIDSGRDYEIINTTVWKGDWIEVKRIATKVVSTTLEASRGQSFVAQLIAVSEPLPPLLADSPPFLPTLWGHLDAIPFIVRPPTLLFDNLPDPSPEYYAITAVNTAIKHLHPTIHSAVAVGSDPNTHAVLVDAAGQIRIAGLSGYEQTTSPKLWRRFMALVRHVKSRKIKVLFASATSAGGGVALMRHALIRLMRLVGIDVRWIVPEGHPAVFNITKKHIHNVLQGVSEHHETLGPAERLYFEAWTQGNWEAFWRDSGLFQDDRIVIIDDPQLTALIPLIKKKNPNTKIIFRSHIQIQSDLTDDPTTTQHEVFSYLWDFIKQTDLFLAHPVRFFVPKCVRETELPVLYMPPSTDPLDGLNKALGFESVLALREAYNNLSRAQCGVEMDWDRGYILQVARFDPSKGLPVLLEAYLKFRKAVRAVLGENGGVVESPESSPKLTFGRRNSMSGRRQSSGSGFGGDLPSFPPPFPPPPPWARSRGRQQSYDFGQAINGFLEGFTPFGPAPKHAKGRKPPMLIVVGHGSVDDPDGSAVYEQLQRIVHSTEYSMVVDDISMVRAPPSDTLLGMLMQGAWVACQLSTREGFEVKVSEAVNKRIPIIVSRAGGLPLQIKEGINGWLVEPGQSEPVANILMELWEGKRKLKRQPGKPGIKTLKDMEGAEQVPPPSTQPTQPKHAGGLSLITSAKQSLVEALQKHEPGRQVVEALRKHEPGRQVDGKPKPNLNAETDTEPKLSHINANEDNLSVLDLDPNSVADFFVQDTGRPYPPVRGDNASPSEDFFTVGNAARWLLLWSLLDGREVKARSHELIDGDVELLVDMGIPVDDGSGQFVAKGGKAAMAKWNEDIVWKMLMREDTLEDEGVLL